MNLPEGVKRLFVLVSAGYWVVAIWWVGQVSASLSTRGGSGGDGEEATDLFGAPPLVVLHDALDHVIKHFRSVLHSQPFFVLMILAAMYFTTCITLYSLLWLLDGFRQDRPVSVGSRRHSG